MQKMHSFSKLFSDKRTLKALLIWTVAAFFYGYEFLLRASPAVMQFELQESFMLDAGGLGFIVSLYYWAYASMQVPAGMLMDRFGPRLILTCAALICAVSTIVFALAPCPSLAGAARFLIGFGSAFALIGTFKLAGNWFSSARFAFFAGFALTFGTIGATLAGEPLAILVGKIGWRESLVILGFVGIVNAILLWVVIHDHPDIPRRAEKAKAEKKTENKDQNVWATFKKVLMNPQSWFIGAFAAFIYIPITCFGELWGVSYIMKSCSCDKPQASFIISLIFIGITAGAPIFGWVSDFLRRRKFPLFIGTFGSLISITLALYFPNISPFFMSVLMVILGISLGSHMILFALIRENNPPNSSAVAAGFGNFVCMIIPGLCQYLIGMILDLLNTNVSIMDPNAYSLSSLKLSLLLIPVGLVLAVVCLSFTRETYARQINQG